MEEAGFGKKGGGAKKGGKKGKKGKKAAASPSGSDDEGEDNIADLLAAMAKGSDDELD